MPLELNQAKWAVLAGGEPIGRVTSAIWSPRLGKNIGYAMVPVSQAALGTRLEIAIPGAGPHQATVVAKPFVDPGKEIPRG
jgi:aminomethyltransferase